ncbi:MAG: ferrous iron transport protein B [Treponema sp.]|nr:MAG: ferrous iron transport protein B [Treponema sp.]
MRVALAGNPNSGKTTLFNGITGKIEKVGNWAGVTIAKKEGKVKSSLNSTGKDIVFVDLPGAYSMSPYTSEESITRDFVINEKPDAIINIVDSTNLGRNLFFTVQLLELGIPVVIALNKSDLYRKKEIDIDVKGLEEELGVKIVETTSTSSSDNNFAKLIDAVGSVAGKQQHAPIDFSDVDINDVDAVQKADEARYEYVKKVAEKFSTRKTASNKQTIQDAVDRVVANRWLGIPIFAVVMWLVFSISQTYVGTWLADILVGWLESGQEYIAGLLENASPFLQSLLVDGVIGGVIAVLGFLPLIMVLFFLLALLEDSGYMARVAVVMDRYLKKVGLSGKSIIPMVVSTGCAIPGVMSTRTIKDLRQRRTTAMLSPFMPCGAKLPVIALFAAVFFKNSSWISTSMYFSAIIIIILSALLIVRITGEKDRRTYFIMELPEYRFPSIKRALISMLSRGKAFIIKAGTIILLCNAAVQIMQAFNWSFELVAEGAENTSILASISNPFAILFIPLGFGIWQLAAAAITGFIAKENVVGTLAVVFSITNFIDTDALELVEGAAQVGDIMGLTSVAALAYLMFNLFTPPCFAAIGAMRSEMESGKWLWAGIGLQFGIGYVVAFLVYQIGTLITAGHLGSGFIPGLIVVLAIAALLVYLVRRGNKIAEQRKLGLN